MEFNWEAIEKGYGPEMTQMFRETVEFLAKKGATVRQAGLLGEMLKVETEIACRPAEQQFRDSLNNLKLNMP